MFIDSNIVLYLLGGDETLVKLLDGKELYLSFITELEVLGYPGITKKKNKIKSKNFLKNVR